MTIQAYGFGLKDAKIAVWNDEESYGTAVTLDSVQMYGVELATVSGQLEGNDRINDVHAKIISGNVRFRFGFKSLDVIEVLTGETNTESTTVSHHMVIGENNMPYFAICGQVEHTEGGGDIQIFMPKVKLTEGFSFSMEYGAYVTPEISAMAVYESATYGMCKIIQHATSQTVTIPPT